MSNRYKKFNFVTHHLRICSFLVHMNISMRYENSPNFSSILLLVPELQHFQVGIFRGKHVFVAAIFTTPVHITLSLKFDRVVKFI